MSKLASSRTFLSKISSPETWYVPEAQTETSVPLGLLYGPSRNSTLFLSAACSLAQSGLSIIMCSGKSARLMSNRGVHFPAAASTSSARASACSAWPSAQSSRSPRRRLRLAPSSSPAVMMRSPSAAATPSSAPLGGRRHSRRCHRRRPPAARAAVSPRERYRRHESEPFRPEAHHSRHQALLATRCRGTHDPSGLAR